MGFRSVFDYYIGMNEELSDMLAVGGKKNSLGRVNDVIELILADKTRLDELYSCLFNEDAWIRMRAADALEKICRQHPEWILPYIDRFPAELHQSSQPSIQWHVAQIYREVSLTDQQKSIAIKWLEQLLSNKEVDWIASANAMDTLAQFVRDGDVSKSEYIKLLEIQQGHTSKSVVRRATKILESLS